MGKQADWDIVTTVGATALAVAAARAIETNRPDRLMSDPWASTFVEAARLEKKLPTSLEDAGDSADGRMWRSLSTYLGVRSRFFDDFFAQAASDQVVLLASGLDMRGYRLDWPAGTTIYELDMPKVLDFKSDMLKDTPSAVDVRYVRIDLRDDWPAALLAAGFDTGRPTAWLAEGLVPFLPEDATVGLFANMHRLSASGSVMAVEHVENNNVREMTQSDIMGVMKERFGFSLEDLWLEDKKYDPADWLTERGWTVTSEFAEQFGDRHGRPFPPDMAPFTPFLLTTASLG